MQHGCRKYDQVCNSPILPELRHQGSHAGAGVGMGFMVGIDRIIKVPQPSNKAQDSSGLVIILI